MIIKSHIRGGYRAAADYLKEAGKNEKIRTVEISDLDAKDLDQAFHNMWVTACNGKSKKPLHHISINPFKDEWLTDEQVLKIVERAEQKYGYKPNCHQRVIVEHVLNGRQHFHVIWCRVSVATCKTIWPGHHWKKSKQTCREMEKELGLKTPVPRRVKKLLAAIERAGRSSSHFGRYQTLKNLGQLNPINSAAINANLSVEQHAIRAAQRQAKAAEQNANKLSEPIRPTINTKGWPEAAAIAWESWGRHDPVRFFKLWAELADPGLVPRH